MEDRLLRSELGDHGYPGGERSQDLPGEASKQMVVMTGYEIS